MINQDKLNVRLCALEDHIEYKMAQVHVLQFQMG